MMWQNSIDGRGKILIENPVIEFVRGYCQNQAEKTESGGILLGYRRGNHLHIVAATAPQPEDQRRRFRFFRSAPHHQKVALHQWKLSGKTMDYLGEWHTHPEPVPAPSSLDISEWKKICRSRKTCMVFLIVGWAGAIWLGVGRGHLIEQVSVCKD